MVKKRRLSEIQCPVCYEEFKGLLNVARPMGRKYRPGNEHRDFIHNELQLELVDFYGLGGDAKLAKHIEIYFKRLRDR